MNEIVDAVKRVTDIMLDIAAASDEQSRGIVPGVSQAISQRWTGYATKRRWSKASAAAASLEKQAARLTQAVDAFRLRDTGATIILPLISVAPANWYFSRGRV